MLALYASDPSLGPWALLGMIIPEHIYKNKSYILPDVAPITTKKFYNLIQIDPGIEQRTLGKAKEQLQVIENLLYLKHEVRCFIVRIHFVLCFQQPVEVNIMVF